MTLPVEPMVLHAELQSFLYLQRYRCGDRQAQTEALGSILSAVQLAEGRLERKWLRALHRRSLVRHSLQNVFRQEIAWCMLAVALAGAGEGEHKEEGPSEEAHAMQEGRAVA